MRTRLAALLLALSVVLGLALVTTPAASAATGYAASARCTVIPTTIYADVVVKIDNARHLDWLSAGWYTDPDSVRVRVTSSAGVELDRTFYPRLMTGSGAVVNYGNTNYIPVGSRLALTVVYGGNSCSDTYNAFYASSISV